MPDLTEQSPIDRGRMNYEQILPIHLNVSHFDSSLYSRPGRLKDFVYNHMQDGNGQEIIDSQKRHVVYAHALLPYKNFFSNKMVNIFTFTSSIISMITIILVIYLYCKHKHIRTIIASLILHKIKEVEAITPTKSDNTECQTLIGVGFSYCWLNLEE